MLTLSKDLVNKDKLVQTVVALKKTSRLTGQWCLGRSMGEFNWRVNHLIYLFKSHFAFCAGSSLGKDKNRRGKTGSSQKLI